MICNLIVIVVACDVEEMMYKVKLQFQTWKTASRHDVNSLMSRCVLEEKGLWMCDSSVTTLGE